ncbi:hypothetical protein NS334_08365 [Sphingomonas endophytica]|uniref:Helix-turn-helix domain-containing protein n=1 Tax=Sphingomonas endophytica TaxID=869719 RepID=A0A147I3I5_9SPHN|nr:hypothetical protein NS334_08365 [Sphingomonas endophytica]
MAGSFRPRRARSGSTHRTGAPVRRNSLEEGSFEDDFFLVPAKGETDRLLRLARHALDAGRRLKREARKAGRGLSARERTIAAITAATVRVYEELLTLARLNRGRVYPSYDWLAEATALGRDTISRALNALEKAGFLVRQRRFRRRPTKDGGPRWEQTSNAYRPLVPDAIMSLLPRWLRPAPVPVDVLQQQQDRAEDQQVMLASLSSSERVRAMGDSPLLKALARLGKAVDLAECES